MFGRRPDGRLVQELPPIRRFMPFISKRRNDSLVYFAQDVEVDAALRFVDEQNRARPAEAPLTLFHLLLRAIAQILDERPRLNRFTAGGRVWQRDGIWITFSAKQRMDDAAPIITVKRRFDPRESLDTMVDRLHGELRASRSGRQTTSDREMGLLLRLPAFMVRAVVGLGRVGNELGLLPRAMIEGDPMFASVFVANLGSVGLEAGYHHLWEYGTIPIFCVMGRVKPAPRKRRIVTLKWTFDERVEDGLYCARGVERLLDLFAHPEKLA
ncbi:MAG: hypothetical protein JSU66_04465 [Deltaproteobacteria bacterium]|nr:MAG: hypothetical protein JSU66_04465 [Deltaproteobacteria bacterium]